MYTYGWFMLMFDRNQHSSVKPLSFNYIKLKKKKKEPWGPHAVYNPRPASETEKNSAGCYW